MSDTIESLRADITKRDRRIAELEATLRLASDCPGDLDEWVDGNGVSMRQKIDAALSAPAQPATATHSKACKAYWRTGVCNCVAAPPSPAAPLVQWTCVCGYMNVGLICTKCGAIPSPAAREATTQHDCGKMDEALQLYHRELDHLTAGALTPAILEWHSCYGETTCCMDAGIDGKHEPECAVDNSSSQAVVDRLVSAIGSIDMINRRHEDSMNGANVYTRGIRDEVIAALDAARSK